MTTIEILMLISSMLGGLALFLSGMNTMSDSLAAMTGGSLNRLIGKVTKNRFLAFLFGAVMTVLVQSASAISWESWKKVRPGRSEPSAGSQ